MQPLERRTGEIGSIEIRAPQVRRTQVRVAEQGVSQICPLEVDPVEESLVEIDRAQRSRPKVGASLGRAAALDFS